MDIASVGYSEHAVIERLAEMRKKWNGQGVADIEKWRSDIQNGSLAPHLTVIDRPTGSAEPSITASIHYHFGDDDSRWFIMVTFFWNMPLIPSENTKEPGTDSTSFVSGAHSVFSVGRD